MKRRLRIKPFFAWYDCWIGLFYDQKKRILYFCPLLMLCIKFWWDEVLYCDGCGVPLTKTAYWTGEGWYLHWLCPDEPTPQCVMSDEMVIEWPFGDDFVTTDYLESRDWYIV